MTFDLIHSIRHVRFDTINQRYSIHTILIQAVILENDKFLSILMFAVQNFVLIGLKKTIDLCSFHLL
jgi:hypothetical protein